MTSTYAFRGDAIQPITVGLDSTRPPQRAFDSTHLCYEDLYPPCTLKIPAICGSYRSWILQGSGQCGAETLSRRAALRHSLPLTQPGFQELLGLPALRVAQCPGWLLARGVSNGGEGHPGNWIWLQEVGSSGQQLVVNGSNSVTTMRKAGTYREGCPRARKQLAGWPV